MEKLLDITIATNDDKDKFTFSYLYDGENFESLKKELISKLMEFSDKIDPKLYLKSITCHE